MTTPTPARPDADERLEVALELAVSLGQLVERSNQTADPQTQARLPESQVTYDWRGDTYTLTTPARFASRLGAEDPVLIGRELPLADHLFDYQAWALRLALDAKRFALWLDTGLGKTAVYLEWARQVQALTGSRVLILAPLAVIPQAIAMHREWYPGLPAPAAIATRDGLVRWCAAGPEPIALCNYEKFIPGVIPELRLLGDGVRDQP